MFTRKKDATREVGKTVEEDHMKVGNTVERMHNEKVRKTAEEEMQHEKVGKTAEEEM